MGEVGEYWRDHKEYMRGVRKKNLEREMPLLMSGWTKHDDYHFSGTLQGKRIDYWPTRNRFQYEGKVMCGGIEGFIKKHDKVTPTSDIDF